MHPGAFTFREVELGKVVWIDWHGWNFASDLPPVLPREGEPENYLLDGGHSPEALAGLGSFGKSSGGGSR
jgi:hypothetical protein